ncbi:aldo/keto reductase [Sphingobium sp. H39-3-25]|uniref:aldo/keto reductase n=1 Tax=Sphingobium arseniciresistens TaxID=3030834 RepID=UPI0023B8C557|nr:aldo/keto reductase [Sphingobium arseniciresistens]
MLGRSRADIALAWVIQKRGVSAPIIGATKIAHLTKALDALSLTLSASEIAELQTPNVLHAVAGFE